MMITGTVNTEVGTVPALQTSALPLRGYAIELFKLWTSLSPEHAPSHLCTDSFRDAMPLLFS